MSRLTRDGTAEPVSRGQILRHARGQGNIPFPCSADHEQDWQPYPVDPYSAICDDHTYIHTYILLLYYYITVISCSLGLRCVISHTVEWVGLCMYGYTCSSSMQIFCVFLWKQSIEHSRSQKRTKSTINTVPLFLIVRQKYIEHSKFQKTKSQKSKVKLAQ